MSGDEPTAGTPVAGRALQNAAEKVKASVVDILGADDWSLLITSDTDLAGSDAAYRSTLADLKRLEEWASQVLSETESVAAVPHDELAPLALPILGAIAGAIPGVVSLLSSHRTVTTGKLSIDDVAASAALAGVLKGRNPKRKVFLDSVRLLPTGGEISQKVDALSESRRRLTERKIVLEAKPKDGTDVEQLTAAIALVAKVSEAIDATLGTLMTVPEGATRSPLAAAILREGLHDGTFKHVLFVKAQSASGMQLVNDKPLWLDDTFAVLAAASISWILVGTADGDVLDSEVTTGTARAEGTIGRTFQMVDE